MEAVVSLALQELIARRGQQRLVELLGQLDWDEAYDYKAGRNREDHERGSHPGE